MLKNILACIELLIAKNMLFNGTNQMVLVSFKDIHILPSYGQKMKRMPIVAPIGLKFFMGAKETIIYCCCCCKTHGVAGN